MSFEWRQPVGDLIWERMGLTLMLSIATLAVHLGHRLPDRRLLGRRASTRSATTSSRRFGFIGLAIPNFLLALVLMYVGVVYFGADVGGLFSPEYQNAPWSLGQVRRPVASTSGCRSSCSAPRPRRSLIRIMRANLLDELNKPYVDTARAKGLSEFG